MALDTARRSRSLLAPVVLMVTLLAAWPAWAYIGPGAGLSAIGSIVALFAAVGLAIVGFVWYPVKRLRRRRAEKTAAKGREEPVEKPAG